MGSRAGLREQVTTMWTAGATLRAIREATSLTDEQIHKILRTVGAKPIRKGGRPPRV